MSAIVIGVPLSAHSAFLAKMTTATLRLAQAAMGNVGTKVAEICAKLGITRQTLYRHVTPKEEARPDGEKPLAQGNRPAAR